MAAQIGQRAALWGLRNLGQWLAGQRAEILDRRAAITDGMGQLETGGWQLLGLGAYFAYLRHPFARSSADLAPQLEEAAKVAGLDPDEAIRQLSTTQVRVLTIGFAPGQPYLGELDPVWNIPRQQALTKSVPAGALVVAIRQLVVFTSATPTGWRHVGQTAFRTFRQSDARPFALTPGDELVFPAVSVAEYEKIIAQDTSGNGGAEREAIP